MMSPIRLVSTTLVLALVAMGTRHAPPAAPAAAPAAVRPFAFQPDTVRVAAGGRVTWANQDDVLHTATAGTPERRTGAFALAMARKGDTASVALAVPGTYAYFCDRHQFMRG